MNKINMQYPFDHYGRNELLDGEEHQIKPENLYPITLGGRTFYIMEYFDYSANCQAITLLIEINGTLAKVPLDNYDYLTNYMENNNLRRLNANEIKLPEKIRLAETLEARNLFEGDGRIVLNQYVPINTNGVTIVRGCSFSSSGVIIELDDTETYMFDKSPSFKLKDDKIREGLNNYYIDEAGVKRYDFTIDVPAGTIGRIITANKEGEVSIVEVLIISGKHEYHTAYSDFVFTEDYMDARRAGEISIFSTWPNYHDVHDTAVAFRDGGNKKLEMSFNTLSKNKTSHFR